MADVDHLFNKVDIQKAFLQLDHRETMTPALEQRCFCMRWTEKEREIKSRDREPFDLDASLL